MTPYLIGYACLFLIEASTVFLNEWFDYDSDRRNRNGGPFTGGSRMLVDGRLDHSAMRKGIGIAIVGGLASLIALVAVVSGVSRGPIAAFYALFAVLAVAYTVPPLKFSHRGFGALDVALTHSAGAIMAGYLVQGGIWTGSMPWLLSLPLSVAILPSILLAGCPDRDADQAAGKRTMVVMLGKRGAIRLAMAACLAAPALAALVSMTLADLAALLTWSAAGGALHAAWLWRRLQRLLAKDIPERIDGPIVLALTFILWFCVPPLGVVMIASGG